MSSNRTLALIKPDAVEARIEGYILEMIGQSDLMITAIKKLKLTLEGAAQFYAVHEGKPFFDELIHFISSGPIYAIALEGESAVTKWRELMGATNPAEAAEGTIRNRFAESVSHNAVHGSDSIENARYELALFFSELEYIK